MTSLNGNIFRVIGPLCVWNSPVTGEFPGQRPVSRSFDVFFDLRLNKRLSQQSWGWWFKTPSRSLWRHCNATKPLPNQCWLIVTCIHGNRHQRDLDQNTIIFFLQNAFQISSAECCAFDFGLTVLNYKSIQICRCRFYNEIHIKHGSVLPSTWLNRPWLTIILTHWGLDKMTADFQTTFSNAFSLMKLYEFLFKSYWSIFPKVRFTEAGAPRGLSRISREVVTTVQGVICFWT